MTGKPLPARRLIGKRERDSMQDSTQTTETVRRTGSLRIGLFTDTYAPQVNGVSISLQLLSEGLRAAGHEVTIFAPRFPGYEDDGDSVFRAPSLRYLNEPPIYVAVPGTPRFSWSLSRRQFDVLHAHSPLTIGLLAYVTASTKNLPLIYTYHTSITDYTHYIKYIGDTSIIRRAARWFSTTTTNLGHQVVVPSSKFKRLLLDQKVRKPIHVIPNGIDLSRFKEVRPAGVFRARLGIEPDAPILLSVGRVDPEKRLEFLIEAFTRLPERSPAPHLIFAGDGSARKDLEARAAASPARTRIHFLGMLERAELPGLLHEATLFVSASTTEVHPLSMIEAIASGLPVVAVQDQAFEGMLLEGENGHQTALNVEAFNNAVLELFSDPHKLAQYGQRSLEISQQFSIEGQVQAMQALYVEAILQNWRPKSSRPDA